MSDPNTPESDVQKEDKSDSPLTPNQLAGIVPGKSTEKEDGNDEAQKSRKETPQGAESDPGSGSTLEESGSKTIRKIAEDATKLMVGMSDSFHYEVSDEPTTESEMCTEESIEKMTSSTEGMISLSEDSSGKDTYAQAATAVYSWPPATHSDTIDLDDSDDQMNGLMGSYREISMDEEDDDATRDEDMHPDTEEEVSNLSNDSNDENETTETDENRRPNSLNLPRRLNADSGACSISSSSSLAGGDVSYEKHRPFSSHRVEGILGELPGIVTKEGDMVSFVVDDLQEKIKMASPIAKKGDLPSYPGSRSSTPNLYKQSLVCQIPPIDPNVLHDLETQTQRISANLDTMLENLMGTLNSMSSLSVDCVESYQNAVCKTCDSIDANIKSMYQLMAKCEELSNAMRPMYRLADQIKEIKRLLDLFEPLVNNSSVS